MPSSRDLAGPGSSLHPVCLLHSCAGGFFPASATKEARSRAHRNFSFNSSVGPVSYTIHSLLIVRCKGL